MVVVLPLALVLFMLGFSAMASVPGCGCEVSRCCSGGPTQGLATVVDALPGVGPRGYAYWSDSYNTTNKYTPTCDFLHFIPGAFDEGGVCSQVLNNTQNVSLCDALLANEQATSRLSNGRSVLSMFREPGSCAQLDSDVCWSHGAGRINHQWDSFDANKFRSCSVTKETTTLAYRTSCESEGLSIKAKWVDGNQFNACEGNYAGGLQITLGAADWTTASQGSPRWRCFDIPRGQIGMKDHRIVAYSMGDVPCVSGSTTTTTAGSESSSGYRANAVIFALVVTTVKSLF